MKKLAATLLVALAFSLVGCKGPEGPVGPAGKNGQNAGFVYFEGFKDSLKCASCHNPDIDTTYRVMSRKEQWATSKHSRGGDFDRNGAYCAGCHTTEGFLDRAKMNFSTQWAFSDKPNSSPQNCFSCHSPHSRGNFSLRDTTALTLTNVFVGGADKPFDGGSQSNLCVKCHQPRNVTALTPAPNVTAAATDTIIITTPRWYQHYGVQPQMFLGTNATGGNGGFEFPGYTYANSYHTTLITQKTLGCVTCHMQNALGAKAGGHTMKLGYDYEGTPTMLVRACKTCHSDITPTPTAVTLKEVDFQKYKNAQITILAQLDTLANMMMDTTITKKWNLGGSNKVWLTKTISPEGEAVYSSTASSSSPIKIKPAAKAGAFWNFWLVEHDMSKGIHNFKYANSLLTASITELRK